MSRKSWNQSTDDARLRSFIKKGKMNDRQVASAMGFSIETVAVNRRRIGLKQPGNGVSETVNWDKKSKPNQKLFEKLMQGVRYD